jgi:asparagine synthase (glutamine-hydrolysing)
MCGIAGIVAPAGVDPQLLIDMTHLVSYRGPNGFGFGYAEAGQTSPLEIIHNENRFPSLACPVLGLGSRRLAILDVSSSGDMPMQIEDGAYCIVFNGEIYNYKEIRQELEQRNYRFRTGTDTEVILWAYKEWGEDCLKHFNGMWSFALFDRSQQILFCSRDRFGVKPFYYTFHDGKFFFGSEIKQVLLASRLPRMANPSLVHDFLEWGLLDHTSETFFEGVNQLPGGHSLRLKLSSPANLEIRCFWKLELKPEKNISVAEATHKFRSKFQQAVKIRLRSDVPVGVCLSGGLDSSAILCMSKEIAPNTQFQSFSACFEDKALDEREYISAVVAAVGGTGHSSYPQGKAFWETVNSIVYHQDEPLGSASAYAQWCVMADSRKNGVPVMLGGQGGDEILCGYQKYRYFYFWQLLRNADPLLLREFALWARNGTRSYWTIASASRYFPSFLHKPFSLLQRLGNPEFRMDSARATKGLGAATTIAERQRTDLTFSSIPALLRHEDRNSMAHSVESRLPFLDYELAEFAVNCPASLKMRDGWSKWLLRNAMKNTLPESVRQRKTKLGFNTPEASWMRFGLSNGHRELWDTPNLKMQRFLDAPNMAAECKQFLQASRGALPANSLFRAISLELWARVHSVS